MARFLDEIRETKATSGFSLLQPQLQTSEIVRVATSGNQIVDTAFKHINKIANNLDSLERKNELLDIDRASKQNINEYEVSWGNKDKYSPDNYDTYKTGLSEVYKKNKSLINDTKYTKAEDVSVWSSNTDNQLSDKMFTEEGKRNQYRTKSVTDHTLLNIQSLEIDYKNTGSEDNENKIRLKKEALNMYDNLSKVGIPAFKIEQLKMQTLIDFDNSYMTKELDDIVDNPNISYDEKVNKLNLVMEALNSNEVVEQDLKEMVANKMIPDTVEGKQMYKNILTNNLETKYGGSDGLIKQSLFKLGQKRNSDIEKANKDVQGVFTNIKSGNSFKAIETLEGVPISSQDLMSEYTGLSKKYYGMSVQEIQNSNNFIPAYSLTHINSLRNQSKTDLLNGIPRTQTVQAILQNIDPNTNDGTMKLRQLYQSGVINQFEYDMFEAKENSNDPNQDNADDFIDGGSIGRANKNTNKLNNFVWITTSTLNSELKDNIDSLSFEKRQIFSEIVTGMTLKNGGYGALSVKGELTPVGFGSAYKTNAEFKSKVDSLVNNMKIYNPIKYKEAKFKYTDEEVEDTIARKYRL